MIASDLLLIDKPEGITSFDVIRILRKQIGVRKMGHAGTLDPLATGLLIIGIGKGTKKLKDLIGLDKVYEAEITLGYRTSTGDREGDILEEKPVPKLTNSQLTNLQTNLLTIRELPVPKYSAIKKHGKPLYKYAREGKDIEVPIKPMRVYDVTIQQLSNSTMNLTMRVSSGTYIRSIAEYIGEQLGTVGTLTALRRTKVGDYRVENAETIS
jgi:tRNA pseudouridine55 synthase